MTYYAFINNDKIDGIGQCPSSGGGITCVEITEQVYNNIEKYMWNGSDVVLNPNWEEEKQEQEKQARNIEIDNKIKELYEMALPEIIQGNTENVKIYQDVIEGLSISKEVLNN